MMDAIDWTRLATFVVGAVMGGVVIFNLTAAYYYVRYYIMRKTDPETWKIQAKRFLSPKLARSAVLLSNFNMVLGGLVTGVLIYAMTEGMPTAIYTDVDDYGWAWLVVSIPLLFVLNDAAAYYVHRLLHQKWLFRNIHRYHHRYVATNPYVTVAVHPLELLALQASAFLPLFFIPFHAGVIGGVLVYILVFNIVDHSGVRLVSMLPWQGPSMYHDDHHPVPLQLWPTLDALGPHPWDAATAEARVWQGRIRRPWRSRSGRGRDPRLRALPMMFATLPWQLPDNLPWQVMTSPLEQWDRMPSFLIGEVLFIALAALALWHARRNGRAHVFVWVAAIIAGTGNDIIFMTLPLVDNFWQAQATVMLTPRLPLYIPCVYVCFMYLPTVAVWRLGLNRWSGAALTGLAAIIIYAPYDIVGAKYLWWTWHDTDAPIAARILGAPMASTTWVITFSGTFAWLVRVTVDGDPDVSDRSFVLGLLRVALLTSILMVLQLTILQQLDGGVPGPVTLAAVVLLYLALSIWGMRQPRPMSVGAHDRILAGAMVAYFATLLVIVAVFNPETHRNTSLHQTYGECHVEAIDITGTTRYEFVCAQDYDEDFTFSCADALPAEGTDWYTVCGRPHSNRAAWVGGVGGLGLVGIMLYGFLFGLFRREHPPAG